jgi:acylphosphatase
VEAEVQGAEDDVERMRTWLGTGPAGAGVSRIDVTAAEPASGSGFVLRDTV